MGGGGGPGPGGGGGAGVVLKSEGEHLGNGPPILNELKYCVQPVAIGRAMHYPPSPLFNQR